MRLKSLYIKGFKSFANETVLHFNDDVIGVVGPNGSGKSNIVDAIRWVLGEQKSKELRLESMSDVIFNGTKTRKEAPTAIVELTFENDKNLIGTEYSTVSISRTLYRSGESEYRLNDVACRLKDITTLFMDTGIGSNSYAIIALGMVDDILADKDNARRKMFEQAAGISKYKKRKKETLSKLKSTSADLDRINDLLFEIEGNMKTLEKQAKRTKKYFEIKDKYKDYAVNLASRSIKTLKEEYKVLNAKVAAEQDVYQQLNAALSSKEAEVEREKKKNLDKEINLSEKQKELSKLVAELRSSENEKDLLEQRIDFKNTNIAAAQHSIKENTDVLTNVQNGLGDLELKIKSEQNKANELQQELEVSQQKYEEIKSRQGEVKQLSDAKNALLKKLQDQTYENEKLAAITSNTIDSLSGEAERIKQQVKDSTQESKAYVQQEKEIDQKVTLKEKELQSIKSEESLRKERIAKLEDLRDATQEEVNRLNRILDSKQNEFDLLKSMVENFEGFPESIKFLANNWRKDVPILSDLLDVNESYKSVIEQYLEPYLNYYVVENLVQAKEAIRLLTGSQKGKANFFLLDELPKVELDGLKIDRTIPAIDVVTVDLQYQGLANYLLKDAFVFDGEIDDFIIDPAYNDKVFLSKVGTFIKTKTSISGGSVGLFEGKKIGRKKNLEKLRKTIEKNEGLKAKSFKQLEQVKSELSSIKQSNLSSDIDKLNRELNTILQERVKVTTFLENIKRVNAERLSKSENHLIEVGELTKKLEALKTRNVEIEAERLNVENQFEDGGGDLEHLNEEMRLASERFNGANISLIKQQNLIQNFEKDLDYKKSRIQDLNKSIKLDQIKLEKDKQELIDSKASLTLYTKKLEELYKKKSGFQGTLSEAEQEYYQARNAISGLEEEVKNVNRNLNQKQVEINNLKDKFNDVRFKISAVGERLKIEFDININDIINEEVDDSMPIDELNEKVDRLKKRLANYGEINPMALEAYEEIKGRYENIITQQQDILDAKDSLMATIKEIESTATEKFMESFEQVRSNFIMVFRSLFTEDDNCDLILLDEENPLDSGIEIIAKPKGKKPKSLSQLSGGEKTLTATALLFALYLLKPAPFCIFDEVDAPLDDANIQKFNKIIKKFSKESQFIIVTHNKATMSAVDVLYGVYMQEMGVSGVTPVDFRALKEQPMFEQLN